MEFLKKIRVNILLIAALVGLITLQLAIRLVDRSEHVSNEILALVVGVGLGGLVSVMGQLAQDSPPPGVPQSAVDKIVEHHHSTIGLALDALNQSRDDADRD